MEFVKKIQLEDYNMENKRFRFKLISSSRDVYEIVGEYLKKTIT